MYRAKQTQWQLLTLSSILGETVGETYGVLKQEFWAVDFPGSFRDEAL